MKRPPLFLLLGLLAATADAAGKVEVVPVEVRGNVGSAGAAASPAAASVLATKANLVPTLSPVVSLTAPSLAPTPSLVAPAVAPAAATLRAPNDAPTTPSAPGSLGAAERIASPQDASPQAAARASAEEGRARGAADFDGALAAKADAPDVSGAWSANPGALRPATAAERRAAREPSRPFKDFAIDAAEVGALAAGIQLLAGLLFLAAGAHAAHPLLAGALWGLGASEMIKHLARLHGRITGGWQASHDQKMRHDYGTGQLKDIRGHAYGEDRYDEWTAGAVSARARAAIDVLAVLMGLPWVLSGGPAALALYLGSAVGLIALRRLLAARAARNAPAAPVADKPFEYDR